MTQRKFKWTDAQIAIFKKRGCLAEALQLEPRLHVMNARKDSPEYPLSPEDRQKWRESLSPVQLALLEDHQASATKSA